MNGLTEKMTATSSMLVVLEGNSNWNTDSKITVNWDQTTVPPDQISLPTQVDDRVLEIKKEFLAWAYEVSQIQIDGKTVTEHLKIFDGLSFWWMTLMGEKSPYKCPALYAVFKLGALERLYQHNDCRGIIFNGNDSALEQTLSQWCIEMGHPYKYVLSTSKKTFHFSLKHLFSKLPYLLQACVWLIHKAWTRFRHVSSARITPETEMAEITLVTFFPNIDRKKTEQGQFTSRYWEGLHSLLDNLPFGVRWVWFYFKQNEIDFREAVRLRDVCNETQPEKYKHHLLEEFLTPKSLWLAICLYLKVYKKGKQLKKLQGKFVFPGSQLNFFPFFKTDWETSFFGSLAREEALRITLFDSMAVTLPPGPFGMFTSENQGWELGLISAWRRHRKKMTILSFIHSSFRPLDLCILSDPRTHENTESISLPCPDRWAIGTASCLKWLTESGYPQEKLFPVEALRYLNLMGRFGSERKKLPPTGRILLVASGMTNQETPAHFEMLAEAAKKGGLEKYAEIIFKPHPAFPIDDFLKKYNPPFSYSISTESMDSLWPCIDVVYCPNPSSIGVETAWLGVPVIIPSSVNALNLNPLYGLPGLKVVTNSDMLVEKLNNPSLLSIPKDYFFFDPDLIRWKKFLELE